MSSKQEKGKKIRESFDDIIFEGRNKEYGAYYLRKTYYKSLLPGITLIIVFPLFIFLYQLYLNYRYQTSDSDETTFYYDPDLIHQMDEFAYMQLLEPPKKAEQLKQNQEETPENEIPKIVDSITVNQEEKDNQNLRDTLGMESDSSSLGNEGYLDGTEDGSLNIAFEVDSLPQFPGGNVAMIRFIVNNIRYPEQAIKNNITGIVYVRFCIKKDGSIIMVEIQKGVNALLDTEAIRVVKSMPNWKPGKLRNKNVNVMYSLPINFNLRTRK